MIAIPLPFVIALLLSILAGVLFVRREETTPSAFVFVSLCAITVTIVGLRWSFDYPLFRLLQPILASCIPVTAWYCFASAHQRQRLNIAHFLPVLLITLASLSYPVWRLPLDPILTLLYVGYGIALLRASWQTASLPEQVRLTDIERTLKAERLAGAMLLMSAVIDGALAIDFSLFAGRHALLILAIGHATLLPILAVTVVMMSLGIGRDLEPEATETALEQEDKESPRDTSSSSLSEDEINHIVHKIDVLLGTKEVFLDPDLTLDRLARKSGIPARQISSAINHTYAKNISQVVNEYRIERAKTLLLTTDKTITQIYLDAGFQTKSNFHREFSRLTQQTPSEFRRAHNKN